MQHKVSEPFYHSAAWKALRQTALDRDGGYCCNCMARYRAGLLRKPRRASVVHHIQPIDAHPELALDLGNLRSLCSACHNQKHPEKGRRQAKENRRSMRVIRI